MLLSQKRNQIHFKNRLKVYLKYNSLSNSLWTQSVLEMYKSELIFTYFHKFTNFESQNISKSVHEVYFIFRLQMYI